ncbi:MAG TPA: DUF2726 domain-containing protein [Chloroflexota bacterium]|nr:DUF2726 domain-containing protein [Chloroflexota bacterium]
MDRRKRLLNEYEEVADELLRQAAERCGARVSTKVRVADALEIANSGLSNEEYSYALKSHFDFVVSDGNGKAAFAVEFDGRQHEIVLRSPVFLDTGLGA